MKKASIKDTSARKAKITPTLETLYKQVKDDPSLNSDPDAPILPPEVWANGVVGKYYRPRKTVVSMRIDNDVLAWLKSKGEGHLTRINEILRQQMTADHTR